MTYKNEAEDSLSSIDIHYKDGKLVRKRIEPFEDIKSELKPDSTINLFDDTKKQLYANLPNAELKKDKSITARALNTQLETYNKNRSQYIK